MRQRPLLSRTSVLSFLPTKVLIPDLNIPFRDMGLTEHDTEKCHYRPSTEDEVPTCQRTPLEGEFYCIERENGLLCRYTCNAMLLTCLLTYTLCLQISVSWRRLLQYPHSPEIAHSGWMSDRSLSFFLFYFGMFPNPGAMQGCHWKRSKWDRPLCWLHNTAPRAYCKGHNCSA